MPFRAIRYMHQHALRDAGISALSSANVLASGHPLDLLIDDRNTVPTRFAAAAASHTVVCDRGSGPAAITRIIIPANHNFSGTVNLQADTVSNFATPTLLKALTPTAGTVIDETFTSNTERFVRLFFVDSAQWEFSEFWLTDTVTITAGHEMSGDSDERVDNFVRLEQSTGKSPRLQTGKRQRVIDISYAGLQGVDLTAIEALRADVGLTKTFWVDPSSFSTPPETDEPALPVRFASLPQSPYTVNVPKNGTRVKDYAFTLIENTD